PLEDMAREFAKQKISFIGITTNPDETPAELAKHVKECNLSFPVYQDKDLAIADAVKATVTPEVFLLDGDFVMKYRGRIDNSYAARLKKNQQITQHDLRQALGEFMSGRPIQNPATEAIGCTITRAQATAPKVGAVTYYKDVLPILQNNCQICHRPGEVG